MDRDRDRGRGRGRDRDRGSITLWSLAICVALLAFGGITMDFWRAISGWRRLAAAADAAAAAGASGIDEARYRATGEVVLDEARARRLAQASLRAQGDDTVVIDADIEVDGNRISVTLDGEVDLFLPTIVMQDGDIAMSVTAAADPQVRE